MRSSVAVTGVAAISRDSGSSSRNRDPDGTERDTRARAVATSRIDPREFEWVRLDSVNCEIPKFVSCGGPVATTVRNNPRRCCRTSTSSGYSSHSPPLSAGSYSYYASATSALTSTSTSTKDPYSGLTVIHESETIPRPVWPSPVIYHRIEDRSADYKGIYTCRVCNCAYSCPLPSPPVSPPPTASARETLLQLSRTLNSVINGDVATTPEDILRDISRIISVGIGSKDDGIYECVYPWTLDDKNLSASSYVKNVPSRVNPVNSRLYGGTRCLYGGHNSARSVSLLVKDERMRCEKNGEAGRWTRENSGVTLRPYETSCPYVCKYLNGSHNGNNTKLSLRLEDDTERRRDGLASAGSKYSARMKCGDVDSSSEGTIASSSANNWNRRLTVKSSIGDFDFTLDVTRAERLGRAIARAKRKRRWCRALTVFFGLAFFILSVVVVSLSVTRGRKAFGSM